MQKTLLCWQLRAGDKTVLVTICHQLKMNGEYYGKERIRNDC